VLSAAVLGIRTVSAFSLEDFMHTKYTELYQQTFRTRLREAFVGGVALGYTQLIQFGSNGLLFWVGGQLIKSGDYQFVDVMEAIMTLLMGASGVAMALKSLGNSKQAGEGAQRIAALIWSSQHQAIDCMSEAGDKLKEFTGDIEFKNIEFTCTVLARAFRNGRLSRRL
jgi:ABC-type bacteriocin/lantibiotic exporter with double-glycine peptidase domain